MATKLEIPPYSGWRPRSMRYGRNNSSGDAQKNGKRNRLGKAIDKAIYCIPRVSKMFPEKYTKLCARADELNNRRV